MPNQNNRDAHIKRMADLLRQGATLTDLACPVCASPIFRLKTEELWCAKCEKKAVIVKEGEEAKITQAMALSTLEATLIAKVQEIQERIQNEQNPEELQKLGATLAGLLETLEKTRKAKKL
ncbi:MAG: Sjogren's syndrome/scleroderma autoantigen 1 family protein [Candidatus Bathyarchaeia archaeon]